jgi:hypothetical protein
MPNSQFNSIYLGIPIYAEYLGLQCGEKGKEDMFMRCSVCIHTWYCSSECQEKDWKGGHREFCASYKLKSSSEYSYQCTSSSIALNVRSAGELHSLSFRDYEMVKAVAQWELTKRDGEIKAQLKLPDRFFPPVIEISYMTHPVQLKVMSVDDHRAFREVDPDNPEYDAALERVRGGNGMFALTRTLLPLGNRSFDANFWAQILVRDPENPEEEEKLRQAREAQLAGTECNV